MSDTTSATPYRVLARKYRPSDFSSLIGQEPMVQTLRNAFSSGRIAQAFMLTGVRGVGKTTTARILARAITYESADGTAGPTVDFPGEGVHCRAILEGRHVDVIEMDAASHNGVSDIREIVDAARYAPVSTRAKVYILDEVHMLSGAAFNALLKTLEEPPAHVKFIFATTEIRKVPVTVLSRCQRFDLRRIEPEALVAHLAGICDSEGVKAEEDALRLIARASGGSVRDSLSLLDQAIAHGAGDVALAPLAMMLGLVDRSRVFDLFEAVMAGRTADALKRFAGLYAAGADPAAVIGELADITHLVTRLKIAPDAGGGGASPDEMARALDLAGKLSIRTLSLAWQMLLKGTGEVAGAQKPHQAADMVLVRLCHAADLPSPDDLTRMVRDAVRQGSMAGPGQSSGGAGHGPAPVMSRDPREGAPQARFETVDGGRTAQGTARLLGPAEPDQARAPAIALASIEDLVAFAEAERDKMMQRKIERFIRPVHIAPDRLEIGLVEAAPREFVGELSAALLRWTGRRVMVSVTRTDAPTLDELRDEKRQNQITDAETHPLVMAILERFRGARVVNVTYENERPEAEGPSGELADVLPSEVGDNEGED